MKIKSLLPLSLVLILSSCGQTLKGEDISKEEFIFKKNPNEKLELKDDVNIIKCHNCGASIDATKGICSYCHTKIKYLEEWILEEI